MDSVKLNEIKSTQSKQFVSLKIFLEKIWWNQRHTPSHDSYNFFEKNLMVWIWRDCGAGRVRKNLIPQPAP
jgi:hypothetical protein